MNVRRLYLLKKSAAAELFQAVSEVQARAICLLLLHPIAPPQTARPVEHLTLVTPVNSTSAVWAYNSERLEALLE